MTDEQKNRIIELKQKSGDNISWQDIANKVSTKENPVTKESARSAYRRNKTEYTEEKQLPFELDLSRVKERMTRDMEISTLKNLTKKKVFMDELVSAVKEATSSLNTPMLIPFVDFNNSTVEESAVLLICDVHVGQATPARLNAGWNQNIKVTEEQFKLLTQRVLESFYTQAKTNPWKELVIIDLGDDVEGSDMRSSQHRIVEPLVAKQSMEYGRMITEFTQTMLQVFPKVRWERIPGNHGRTSQRAGIAGLSELDPCDSWDWVAGVYLEVALRNAINEGRVSVNQHEGYVGKTIIQNRRVMFEHGSSIKGGSGGVPYASIDRLASSFRDLYGDYSLLLLGHYHRSYTMQFGHEGLIVGNGSFPPSTPFVSGALHRSVRPSQTLLSINQNDGVTMTKLLYLDTEREQIW